MVLVPCGPQHAIQLWILYCTGGDLSDALQPGNKLIAAAFALYSSATMLVVSWGTGVHGFTLDTTLGDFVLTHPNIKIPQRGRFPGHCPYQAKGKLPLQVASCGKNPAAMSGMKVELMLMGGDLIHA